MLACWVDAQRETAKGAKKTLNCGGWCADTGVEQFRSAQPVY